jgi:hypothetical protein
MSRQLKNIAGQRFGRLTVIKRVDRKSLSLPGTSAYWLCRCDCGNEIIVMSSSLLCGATKSCGCLQSEARHRSYGKGVSKYAR